MRKHQKSIVVAAVMPTPTIHKYMEVEWREDGPYSVQTGEKVAVFSTPRQLAPTRKQLEARLYSLDEVMEWEDANDDEA